MNRHMRTGLVLAVALAAATMASYAVYHALQRAMRPAAVAMTGMVVAAREIPVGTMLTEDDVKVVPWPARTVVPASFRAPEEVAGRGTIDILHENEPLVETKLASRGAGAGLPPTIPPGLRAISIHVNEVIGVAGFVTPGCHVDVLVTLANKSSNQDASTTRMVVSNVQVLTAGTRFDQEKARQDGKPIPTTVVTLQVTPDDAERIALAQNQGQITLTLRNPMDTIPTSTPGVQLAHLLGRQTTPPDTGKAAPAMKKPRTVAVVLPPPVVVAEAKPYTVETIRAAKRTEETIR